MNNVLQTQLSSIGPFVWTLVVGVLLAVAYKTVRRILLANMHNGPARVRMIAHLDLAERVFWPVLLVALAMSLILHWPLAGLALSSFCAMFFRLPIKNYLLGMVYGTGRKYALGQRIKYLDHRGTIRRFDLLSIEMELEEGGMMDIPYNSFAEATIIRTSPKSGVLSHSFELALNKPYDQDTERQRIKKMLLAMPWVLPDQQIGFEDLPADPDQGHLKITVHGIDKEQMQKVERQLKTKYQNQGVR